MKQSFSRSFRPFGSCVLLQAFALLLLAGCGGGDSNSGQGGGYVPFSPENVEQQQEAAKKKNAPKPKTVTVDGFTYTTDDEHMRLLDSWKRFVIKAKSDANIRRAEKEWKELDDDAVRADIRFTAQSPDTYRTLDGFVEGASPTRMYEVPVVEFDLRETYKERGTITRHFMLNFYYPDEESGWTMAFGSAHIINATGHMANLYPVGRTQDVETLPLFLESLFDGEE